MTGFEPLTLFGRNHGEVHPRELPLGPVLGHGLEAFGTGQRHRQGPGPFERADLLATAKSEARGSHRAGKRIHSHRRSKPARPRKVGFQLNLPKLGLRGSASTSAPNSPRFEAHREEWPYRRIAVLYE